ncbi:MAG: YtxH domain-containing protein [Verrucomicrobia bacterium]|nr:YtxH domain-containing protein [Cytophagales bacterium]
MGRFFKNLLVFSSGVAIGTLVGLLYAPEKGSNTRNKLTFRLAKYRDRLKALLAQIADEEAQHLNLAKSEGQKVVNDAKEKAERLIDDVEELMSQIKNKK